MFAYVSQLGELCFSEYICILHECLAMVCLAPQKSVWWYRGSFLAGLGPWVCRVGQHADSDSRARAWQQNMFGETAIHPPRPRATGGLSLDCIPIMYSKRHLHNRAVKPSSGPNVILRRVRPGLAGLRPHTCGVLSLGVRTCLRDKG